jgi:glucose-6-phosphate-specific signal transduction histidine kinase
LTNVVKHAQAKHVSIVLTRRDGSVAAVIEDDGRGITEAGGDGLGLLGMRERIALVDGRLEVESRPVREPRSLRGSGRVTIGSSSRRPRGRALGLRLPRPRMTSRSWPRPAISGRPCSRRGRSSQT